MHSKRFNVFGIGNAMVDILAQVDDSFVADLKLAKGSMSLMDAVTQAAVLAGLEHHTLQLASGGSAANTMVAITQSGGKAVYTGKVAHDTHGEFYKKDLEAAGVDFPVALAPEASFPTGTCVVLTTKDAERTMCTHLGISTSLHKEDVDVDMLAQCDCSYVEGYLWDADEPRAACIETFEQSKRLGVRTAFTFSDAFLIDRFADDFQRVVRDYCDIVFCNADEARRFFETDSIDECARRIGELCELTFMTNSEHGCFVAQNGSVEQVAGFPVKAIDTVGAGDAFAGGTLYGLTNGMSPTQAARWGNYFASRVVEQIGPRLDEDLREHVANVTGLSIGKSK